MTPAPPEVWFAVSGISGIPIELVIENKRPAAPIPVAGLALVSYAKGSATKGFRVRDVCKASRV